MHLFRGLILSAALTSAAAAFWLPVSAGETGSAAAVPEEAAAADGQLYSENEWNYVDISIDASHGIPEDAVGRLERIRETGKLTVATEPYYAPQEFIDPSYDGQAQYVGADMELARLIAERMGVELEIVPLEFADVLAGVAEGTYDLAISGLAYTPGRAGSMELSKGYHYSESEASTGLLIRKADRKKIRSTEDLSDRTIVAQIGSLQEMLIAENIPLYREFVRVASIQEVYDCLEKGEADAAAVDVETGLLYIEAHPEAELMLLEGVGFSLEEQFRGDRVAAPPGELQLVCFVNGVIDEILEDGRYRKWFEEYSEYASELGLDS